MSFSAKVLELAPWSYTMANKAHTCPFAFHQQYIAKAEAQESPRIESHIGTAVHSILDYCIQGATVRDAYRKVIEEGLLYEVEIAVYNYRTAIEEFLEGLGRFKIRYDIVEVYSEKRLGLTPSFESTDYWNKNGDCLIRGAIDLTLLTRTRKALILDHKSGAKKPLSVYDQQVAVYSLLVDAFINDVHDIRTGVHYVGANKNQRGTRSEWGPEYPVEVIRTRFRNEFETWLNTAAEKAQTAEPKKSWLCGFCGYQYLCPLKK